MQFFFEIYLNVVQNSNKKIGDSISYMRTFWDQKT